MYIAYTGLFLYVLLASSCGRVQGNSTICFSQRSQEQGAYPSFVLLVLHSSCFLQDVFKHWFISVHLYYKWTHLFITVCSLPVTQNLIIDSFNHFSPCPLSLLSELFFIVMLNWFVNITGNGQAWWLVVSVLHAGGVLGWSAALEEDQGQGGCYKAMREQMLLIWR